MIWCIPGELPEQGGGGFRFLASFRRWLTERRVPWTPRLTDRADVLLANSWQLPAWKILLWRAWTRGAVLHRTDGWPPVYGRTDGAERRLCRVNRLATRTIYQSRYAAEVTPLEKGPVIYNPVDPIVFSPTGPVRPRDDAGPHVAVVAWSTNPMKGFGSVYRCALEHPKVRFLLCGRFDDGPAAPNLVRVGVLTAEDLAATLRSADALLTFSRAEACPNHVLEALACGVPVLYAESGATAELVRWEDDAAGLPVTVETFGRQLDAILQPAGWRKKARERALMFTPDRQFSQYLHVASMVRRHRRASHG